MKKYKLKNDTMNESDLQINIIVLHILEIQKYFQIKVFLI